MSQLPRDIPERPRFLLTNEQLVQPADDVFWALGRNPFRPAPADEAQRAAWHDRFLQRLAASIAWIEQQPHVDEMILKDE